MQAYANGGGKTPTEENHDPASPIQFPANGPDEVDPFVLRILLDRRSWDPIDADAEREGAAAHRLRDLVRRPRARKAGARW